MIPYKKNYISRYIFNNESELKLKKTCIHVLNKNHCKKNKIFFYWITHNPKNGKKTILKYFKNLNITLFKKVLFIQKNPNSKIKNLFKSMKIDENLLKIL